MPKPSSTRTAPDSFANCMKGVGKAAYVRSTASEHSEKTQFGTAGAAPENAALVALTMMSNFSLIKSTKLPDAQPSAAPAECALSGVRLAI